MIRLLKFRFWKGNVCQGILELKENSILDTSWEWDNVDQFSGLYDKNGKEIYEKDFLRSSHWACDCLVVWEGGGLTLREGETSYTLVTNLLDYDFIPLEDVEIVGNKHTSNLEINIGGQKIELKHEQSIDASYESEGYRKIVRGKD